MRASPPDAQSLPVVLVQGFGCHPRVLDPLARRITGRLGRPTLCLTTGFGFGDIRDTALELLESIVGITPLAGCARVDVVAHSMGGLVSAYMLKCLDQGRRVRRVVALGSPFGGIAGARFAALLGPFAGALAQAAPGSRLLRLLKTPPVPSGSALISISGSLDRLISEASARVQEGLGQHHFDAGPCGHLQLLLGSRAFRQIAHALDARGLEAGAHPASLPTAA